MSAIYKERVLNIENILLLKNLKIDRDLLRGCCLFGIPEEFRPLVWRLFFDYLPTDRQQWVKTLEKQRRNYTNLVENLVNRQSNIHHHEGEEEFKTHEDHPLAQLSQGSKQADQSWISYFRDNDILKQIDNDVRRTRPEVEFFQKYTKYPTKIPRRLSKRIHFSSLAVEDNRTIAKIADKSFITSSFNGRPLLEGKGKMNLENEGEKHWEVMERILYIYAKVNVGVSYTQGMNELLGPIYYVFASDSDVEWAKYAEADSFYCFQYLLSEMQDIFIQKMDAEHCGFEAILHKFYCQLQQNDPELYFRIVNVQQIKAEFFAFRWISLLLTQEFCLADLIALWDHLFSMKSGTRLERVQCLCLSMLELIRDELMDGDFTDNIKRLQNFPQQIDVSTIIFRAVQISEGKTFISEQNQCGKFDKNVAKNILPNVLSSVNSRLTLPLKSLVVETTKKLTVKMGGCNNINLQKPQNITTSKINEEGKSEIFTKNATL